MQPNKRRLKTKAWLAARAVVLAEEHACWVCGQPPTPDDPLVADHVVPRAQGGTDARDNLRAAHRSCNGRRGREQQRLRSGQGGGHPRFRDGNTRDSPPVSRKIKDVGDESPLLIA